MGVGLAVVWVFVLRIAELFVVAITLVCWFCLGLGACGSGYLGGLVVLIWLRVDFVSVLRVWLWLVGYCLMVLDNCGGWGGC